MSQDETGKLTVCYPDNSFEVYGKSDVTGFIGDCPVRSSGGAVAVINADRPRLAETGLVFVVAGSFLGLFTIRKNDP